MEKLSLDGGMPVRKDKLSLHMPFFGEEEIEGVTEAIKSKWVSGDGPKCREFESELAKYLGVKNAFIVTSATAALDLSVMANEFGSGEIIVPDYTFTSTALAAVLNNLKPVFVDVLLDTATIDPNLIEKKISGKTKAIIAVDFAGHPCMIEEIRDIARSNGLIFIEDAAQSMGASYKGKKVGTLADMTCFSFHATKNLVCGEGGAITTNNDEFAEKIAVMREKGTTKKALLNAKKLDYQKFVSRGNSYVQSDILAAVALKQLRKLDKMNEDRAKNAEYLNKKLSKIKNIGFLAIRKDVTHCWCFYCIKVPNLEFFVKAMNAEGIEVKALYEPLHSSQYYRSILGPSEDKEFRNTVELSSSMVRMPLYPHLKIEDLNDIVTATEKVMAKINNKM